MLLLLAIAFVAVPIIELAVIVKVAGEIGIGATLLLVIVVSIVGAWLTRHEGFVVLRRIREQLERGQIPGNELIDGMLVLGGGLLLLTPGFVTDGVGLLMLFPVTRVPMRNVVRRRLRLRVSYERRDWPGRGGPSSDGSDGDIIDL